MPPRGKLLRNEKLDHIVAYLRASGTCHTLKDLEKSLPSVASISSIQVKEFIQILTDDDRLRVEKIGIGNWYWSFDSDERIQGERQLARVKTEVEQARQCRTDAAAALATETTRRKAEEEGEEEGEGKMENSKRETERTALQAQHAELQATVNGLRMAATPAGEGIDSIGRKDTMQLRKELAGFQQLAQQWTDNIYILEEYLSRLASGDREIITAVQRECYGDEYVDGGLRELQEFDCA